MSNTIYSVNKDYSEKPLKLMIKKHMLVGIKYLCKTTQEDHNSYKGSGHKWLRILKEHGRDHVRTKVIFTTHSRSEFTTVGRMLSEKWDIVNSSDWANLIPETGGGEMTEEIKAKISNSIKGRPNPNKGKTFSKDARNNMSKSQMGNKTRLNKKHKKDSKERIGIMSANSWSNKRAAKSVAEFCCQASAKPLAHQAAKAICAG